MRRPVFLLPVLLLYSASCELREIVTTNSEDVVVAEVVLRAQSTVQTAYLYRTHGSTPSSRVPGANIAVIDRSTGDTLRYFAAQDSLCIDPRNPQRPGTCYAHFAANTQRLVWPGGSYALRIGLADGRVMTAETRVPEDFRIAGPAAGSCAIRPDTRYELTWTRSHGTSAYLIGALLHGIGPALAARGIHVWGTEPVDVTGLSVTAADTTLVVPTELGVFDRLDEELHPVLLAVRDGFPAGVRAELVVAAADANFVNWARGGTFNPSGLVRISSVRGDGTGVFGSLVLRDLELIVTNSPNVPPCS